MLTVAQKQVKFQRNSVPHRVLLIAGFYRRPITIADMVEIHNMFSKPGKIHLSRVIFRLETNGLLNRVSDAEWEITSYGRDVLRHIAASTTPEYSDD